MAIPVLILGETGTGKTHSTKSFNGDDVKILSVYKPVLSYSDKGNKKEVVKTPTSKAIIEEMKKTSKKSIVIDDFQFILGVPTMRRSLEKGWDKFSEIQYDYFTVLDAIAELPDDVIVYLMSHTEVTEQGDTKIKTIGKALDKYITIEGLFTIVLGTKVCDGQYYFITQNDGKNTLKSPEGMFESYAIDNDLAYVDAKIRNYYEVGTDFLTDEEIAEIDEEAKRVEIEPPKPRSERKRSRNTEAVNEEVAKVSDMIESAEAVETRVTERKQRKSREEVQAENASKVANAGIEEAEGASEVDFDKVDTPELETPPRRRRRRTE